MSTAFLVVDMQNGFCHSRGSFATLGMQLAGVDIAVRNAARAMTTARDVGTPVIFTRHCYRPGRADEGSNLSGMGLNIASIGGLACGSWDAAIVDELDQRADDLIVEKVRFDAFLWTSLDALLHGLGVKHLVIAGVVTNVCVESTVRSAFMRDYRVTLLADCCAAQTERLHHIALEVLEHYGFATIARVVDGFRFDVATESTESVSG